jgi:hypothetical protein
MVAWVPSFAPKRINTSGLQQPDKGGGYEEQEKAPSTTALQLMQLFNFIPTFVLTNH